MAMTSEERESLMLKMMEQLQLQQSKQLALSTQVGATDNQITESAIPILDGKNYQSWKDVIEMTLTLKGQVKALTEDVDEVTNMSARLLLIKTMDESHRSQVRGCATAKEVMKTLAIVYANKSATNLHRVLAEYYRYEKEPKLTMSEHVGKMNGMRNNLRDLGIKMDDERIHQATIIGSLPSEYGRIMEGWDLTHPDMRTSENLLSRLIEKEKDLEKMNKLEFGLIAESKERQTNQQSYADRMKNTKCYNCEEMGHIAKHCPKPNKKNRNFTRSDNKATTSGTSRANLAQDNMNSGQRFEVKPQWAAIAAKPINLSVANVHNSGWISDSGASSHMCKEKDWFFELTMFEDAIKCTIGDGNQMDMLGIGSIHVISTVEGRESKGVLKKVYFAPSLSVNLFSIGAAAELGIRTMFSANQCRLYQEDTVIAEGHRLGDGLYTLNIRAYNHSPSAMKVNHPRNFSDWHRALGHASAERVKRVLADLMVDVPSDDGFECPDCPEGKGKRSSHPAVGVRAESPGRIHVDVFGPSNKASPGDFKLYMVCKDEWTDYCLVYLCKDKTEIPTKLSEMITEFEAISGHRVYEIFSDNGSEFVNQTVHLLLMRNKIHHVTSAPYCAQQNGRIEREMQTITGSARTMLLASELPLELWPQAIEVAVYVKNRLPNKNSDKTPFERLLNRKPSIIHMVEFGEQVHVIVNDRYLTKWDARTEPGYIVGYTAKSNTYRIYIPSRSKIIRSSDVIFAKHSQLKGEKKGSLDEQMIRVKFKTTSSETDESKTNQKESENQTGHLLSSSEQWQTSTPQACKNKKPLVTGQALEQFFEQYVGNLRDDKELSPPPTLEPADNVAINDESRPPTPPPRLSSIRDDTPLPMDGTVDQTVVARDNMPSPPLLDRRDCSCTNEISSTFFVTENMLEVQHALYVTQIEDPIASIPLNYRQAIQDPEADKWLEAIESELNAHATNHTWDVVQKPAGIRRISSKWVFTLKRDNEGNIERYKARLVARGCEQTNYGDTFAPVARIESLRILLALSAAKRYVIRQFDVSTAFLYGRLKETVYVEPPSGIEIDKDSCLKLNKALYGLKQAPRAWNSTFNETLMHQGFIATQTDQCVYKHKDKEVYVIIYVDDGLVLGRYAEDCDSVIRALELDFKIKRLESKCFIGIELMIKEDTISMCQKRYIKDTLDRFNLGNASGVTCPLVGIKDLIKTDDEGDKPTKAPYRQAVGCLQYIAHRTRPDILFAANFLGRFNKQPLEKHWSAAKRVMRYLKQTIDYEIVFKGPCDTVTVYCDADHANDNETRTSIAGLLINLGSGPIVYATRKQDDTAISSAEAEYIAASEATKELFCVVQFLDELQVSYDKPRMLIDNQPTINQIKNFDTKRRSKHVDIRYHYIRQKYQRGLFELEHVRSQEQVADIFTKALNAPSTNRLIEIGRIFNLSESRVIRSGSTSTMRKSSRSGFLAMLSLICVLITLVNAGTYRRSEDLVLSKTKHQLKIGTHKVQIEYLPISHCELSINDWDSAHDVKRTSYQSLRRECDEVYEANMRSILQLLAEKKGKHHHRKKRFIDPISVGLIISLGVMFVVGTIATITPAVYSYTADGSSYNRLNKIDKENEERDRKALELKEDLLKAKEIRSQQIEWGQKLEKSIAINTQSIKHLASLMAPVAMTSVKMYDNIRREAEILQRITEASERFEASPNEYAQLFKMQQMRDIEPEDTFVERQGISPIGRITLDVYYPIIPSDTFIKKVTAFRHYRLTDQGYIFMEYAGPRYVIHNETCNCTKGIDNPNEWQVYLSCDVPNYQDKRLDDWRAIEPSRPDYADLTKPQVLKTATYNIIYCMFYSIRLNNGTREDCPAFTFALKNNIEYRVDNQQHHVTLSNLSPNNNTEVYATPKLTIVEYVPSKESQWIKENNDKSVQARVLSYDKDTLTIPINFTTLGIFLGILGSLITVGTCLWSTCGGASSQQPQGEHINVINTAAPPQPVNPFEAYPRYYPMAAPGGMSLFSRNYVPSVRSMRTSNTTDQIYAEPST